MDTTNPDLTKKVLIALIPNENLSENQFEMKRFMVRRKAPFTEEDDEKRIKAIERGRDSIDEIIEEKKKKINPFLNQEELVPNSTNPFKLVPKNTTQKNPFLQERNTTPKLITPIETIPNGETTNINTIKKQANVYIRPKVPLSGKRTKRRKASSYSIPGNKTRKNIAFNQAFSNSITPNTKRMYKSNSGTETPEIVSGKNPFFNKGEKGLKAIKKYNTPKSTRNIITNKYLNGMNSIFDK